MWFAHCRSKRPEVFITHVFVAAEVDDEKMVSFSKASQQLSWRSLHSLARQIAIENFDSLGVQRLAMLTASTLNVEAPTEEYILWPPGACNFKPAKRPRSDIDMFPADPGAPGPKRAKLQKKRSGGGVKYVSPSGFIAPRALPGEEGPADPGSDDEGSDVS
jgi:hypothetical protein